MGSRADLVRAFIPSSPFVGHLGIRLVELGEDRAELVLPFRPDVVTIGDVVHGGAIATLVDTAAMAAAWADETEAGEGAGSTVAMSVDYVAAASGEDLTARAAVIRRGRRLCFCEVEVAGATAGVVAKGLVTYRFG
jgi:uncharacterized protein (TIGR00369 family)